MRRIRKISFEDLVLENKRLLLTDKEAMERIEDRIENKRVKK
ncbi:FbpB family small basic protein [Bacillus horti]|uniref:FbpB family small basic protein n=1 Tax=Caldalkalibacillus horti TaxID=77523 RepID=A0ABT9VUH3_9BACI|nr:FbpB family small basic protein [Bacillus horti]MDQ0164628.1 hypothetical protein [Bacillus horti]